VLTDDDGVIFECVTADVHGGDGPRAGTLDSGGHCEEIDDKGSRGMVSAAEGGSLLLADCVRVGAKSERKHRW
jgi:hypothetical protein